MRRPVRHAAPLLTLGAGLVLALALAGCRSTAPEDGFEYGSARPPSVHTLHQTARVMASQGRDEECELVLNRLIAQHPRYLPAYVELAELYLRNDSPEGAAGALHAGLDVAPQDPVLLNDLGMLHVLREDYEPAIELFAAAAAHRPSDARLRGNLALALGMTGRYEESLDVYLQLVLAHEAHHNIGVLAEARGDEATATTAFARAYEERTRWNLR